MVLPSAFRRSLALKPGDQVVMVLEDGHIRLFSRRQARQRAQDLVARLVPKGVSLARELIRERRREASYE